jgi:chromosome segregation ATPase
MEKHNKDLEKITIKKDSLQVTLMQTNANYWKLKTKKDSLSVEHKKLQRNYKNMEQAFLKQQKELEELRKDIGYVYRSKNEIQRQSN